MVRDPGATSRGRRQLAETHDAVMLRCLLTAGQRCRRHGSANFRVGASTPYGRGPQHHCGARSVHFPSGSAGFRFAMLSARGSLQGGLKLLIKRFGAFTVRLLDHLYPFVLSGGAIACIITIYVAAQRIESAMR